MATTTHTGVAIIGAGFSGMGAAIKLDADGRRDWLILDAGDEVGGTWRDNTYPGAACDIPSHLYSYSFEPWDWSEAYSGGPEIQAYSVHVSHKYRLRDRICFGAHVIRAEWSERRLRWIITTEAGDVVISKCLIGAIGGLRDPKWPAIAGLDRFQGPLMHSSRWDHAVELEGRRVGVIGTGASAIQIVPGIIDRVGSLSLLQRTAPWIVPRNNRPYTRAERRRFVDSPWRRRAHRTALYLRQELSYLAFGPLRERLRPLATRIAAGHLEAQVPDPELRRALQPTFDIGCKRVLVDDAYYNSLSKPHASVITTPIEGVEADGIRLTDGSKIGLDVLVCATGFSIDKPLGPLQVIGREGADLGALWRRRPRSYLGMTMPGFPNFFMMMGPNAGLGHNSVIFMIECQLEYVIQAIRYAHRHGTTLDLDPRVMSAWQQEIDRRTATAVWGTGCRSWYLNEDGENFTLWPGSTIEYRWRTRRFDPTPYRTGR